MTKMMLNTSRSKEQKEADKIMAQIAVLRNRLEDLGFIRKLKSGFNKKIFAEYVEHTIANIFNLNLTDIVNTKGYDATSKSGKKI